MLSPSRLIGATIADLVRTAVRNLFHPYRPELHYMRGPGPKWREAQHTRRRHGA
jgi:hypothetical protein